MAEIFQPSDINDAQWAAVASPCARLLVVAGPGTGKTHTLTRRIARRVPQLSDGQKVLAVTFTNKAAEEMRSRLSALIPEHLDSLTVATFHSFCIQILTAYAAPAGLPPDFRLVVPEEIAPLLPGIWPDRTAKERKKDLDLISSWKSSDVHIPPPPCLAAYQNALCARGFLDYDDLLLETLRLFNKFPAVLKEVQACYREIFIDEYQDINPAQHALLKLLAGADGAVTAIGDPNQAIYGFRGSDARFFTGFPRDFPVAEVITLQENYRSAATILSASTQVMAGTSAADVPPLTARLYAQGKLTVFDAATDRAEAEYVAHNIEKLVGGMSMFSQDSGRVSRQTHGEWGFGDIAVLYRLKTQSALLRQALDRLGVPYHCVDGQDDPDPADAGASCPPRHLDVRVDAEKVSLLTLHAAKGLEFPVVFIVGCEDVLLPLTLENLRSDPQEERRLFYVGMTRAKEQLFLVRARRRTLFGRRYEPGPSPFLRDIEERLKEYERAQTRSKKRKPDAEQLNLF